MPEQTVTARMRGEVAAGLARPQKEISPKFFYDHRGSELFEAITKLPEYYPTRAERALLESHVPAWIRRVRPAALVELGAGAAAKTRILLDAMERFAPESTYVPIDISAEFLENAAATLRDEYPDMRIEPLAADMSRDLPLPEEMPRPAVFALLGGTIGNFQAAAAVSLMERTRAAMSDRDRFLLGVDLEKDVALLEAAYNDTAGVTAAFNLNVLDVLNRELDADFDPNLFRHLAFYNTEEHRIEMHLVATRATTVRIPGAGTFPFAEGESLRTEISRKYTRERVGDLFARSGLQLEDWFEGPPGFALAVGAPE
jgi:L-histidine Nalpha-methyltransferase